MKFGLPTARFALGERSTGLPIFTRMDLYRVLGLTHEADADAIRAAYRRLAKRYHPDVSALPDAQARFIAITEAYEVLTDPVARKRYDLTRSSPSPGIASAAAERRHARYTQQRQQTARSRAEAYGRMSYERFADGYFKTVAGYVAPKVLGCFGIMLVGGSLMLGLAAAIIALGLPKVLIFFAFMGVIVAGAWASVEFDGWHDRWRKERWMRTGR